MEKKREIMRQQMRLKRQMQRQFSRFSFPVFHYFKLHFWSILFFTVTFLGPGRRLLPGLLFCAFAIQEKLFKNRSAPQKVIKT